MKNYHEVILIKRNVPCYREKNHEKSISVSHHKHEEKKTLQEKKNKFLTLPFRKPNSKGTSIGI